MPSLRKVLDLIVRHNRVRNWVFKLADQGLLSPEIEKKVLGPTDSSKRRPGDVTIPLWSGGKGLAIDVAVTCPASTTPSTRSTIQDGLSHAML